MKSWEKHNRRFLGDLNLLVIGQGNIGKRVSDKMKNFMRVDTFDIRHNKTKDLFEKIKYADIITIHIPGNPENVGFFDKDKISLIFKFFLA